MSDEWVNEAAQRFGDITIGEDVVGERGVKDVADKAEEM